MAQSSQMDSVLKGAAAAATALLFTKSTRMSANMQMGLSVATGGIVYAMVEQARKTHAAADYAADAADRANAPAPTSGLGRRRRWRV